MDLVIEIDARTGTPTQQYPPLEPALKTSASNGVTHVINTVLILKLSPHS